MTPSAFWTDLIRVLYAFFTNLIPIMNRLLRFILSDNIILMFIGFLLIKYIVDIFYEVRR